MSGRKLESAWATSPTSSDEVGGGASGEMGRYRDALGRRFAAQGNLVTPGQKTARKLPGFNEGTPPRMRAYASLMINMRDEYSPFRSQNTSF